MAALQLLKLSLLLNLLSKPNSLSLHHREIGVGKFPPTCNRIECPSYSVVHVGNGYEIRRYDSPVWMSTSKIQDISFVDATRNGFLQLFNYIQGKNDYQKKIEMTAPVITQVIPSDGPICESSFIVSFYVPKENQADPPPAKGLHAQRWNSTYVAVRQFGGFVRDADVAEQAALLQVSLAGSKWADAIAKSQAADPTSAYIVAQYNSPFEFTGRVNEIWFRFEMDDNASMM